MKALVVLFAGKITGYALESLAGGKSALERAVISASSFLDAAKIVIFCTDGERIRPLAESASSVAGIPCEIAADSSWTVASFFARMTKESEGFDHVYVSGADNPFLDPVFTRDLMAKHVRYAAEYTFADGYPYGLSPDILARGAVGIIANIVKEDAGPVTRSSVFDAIKKEINSFDIETEIAPVDLRQLRLSLACDTKRNSLQCAALDGITAENYAELVASRSEALYGVPAFYAVQVSGKCPFECVYCPYPAYCKSGKGRSPGVSATERNDFMSCENFSSLIEKIASYSEDAVISLSLQGECSYHPDIVSLVEIVLNYPSLSLLIETTGLGWRPEDIEGIVRLASSCALRLNGNKPINWIVSLDAVGSTCYGNVHGIAQADEAGRMIKEAVSFTEHLAELFPGDVWPQMVRMNENEMELETFYRFWKQKLGQVVIQKHDNFCGSIADRRVADLSPLVRNPCWHLKRDLSIMIDGTVPLCREDLYAARDYGNALGGSLADIRAKIKPVYLQHTGCIYEGLCGACDEYYTYNF